MVKILCLLLMKLIFTATRSSLQCDWPNKLKYIQTTQSSFLFVCAVFLCGKPFTMPLSTLEYKWRLTNRLARVLYMKVMHKFNHTTALNGDSAVTLDS